MYTYLRTKGNTHMVGNYVSIVGNLVKDPELRFIPSGKAVASLSIAHNRKWKDQSGADQEETSFFDVSVWDTLAENVADSLGKGDRILVEGRLLQRSWEKDGEKFYKVEIVADEISPSLRWASAKPSRNEKADAVGGKPAGRGNAKAPDYDEEPF